MKKNKTKLAFQEALLQLLLAVSTGLFITGSYGLITGAVTLVNLGVMYFSFLGMLLFVVCYIYVKG